MSDNKHRSMAMVVAVLGRSYDDPFEIVINKGENDGVTIGDRYLVFSIGDEIIDPESGESLGRIEIIKGKGVVTHAQEKMSTIRSTNEKQISSGTKRIIREDALNIFGKRVVEETIPHEREAIPFNGATKGDFAKPI